MAEDESLLNGEIFNDHFNIFVGNKNDLFFHGSSALASNLVSFPVGIHFSDTLYNVSVNNQIDRIRVNDPEDKNSILTRLGSPDIAFFSNIESAMLYLQRPHTNIQSKCEGKCINAFELNQNVNIMVMNDVYNIYKIINYIIDTPSFLGSQKVRNILDYVEGYSDGERLNYLFTNFYCIEEDIFDYNYEYDEEDEEYEYLIMSIYFRRQIRLQDNEYYYRGNRLFGRFSVTTWDLPLCRIFSAFFAANPHYNIQGCGNNLIEMGILGSNRYIGNDYIDPAIRMQHFHPEVIFFEQLKILNRLYTHPIDWQYNIVKDNTRYIKPYLNELEKYKIINFNDYSGDIYETTIWTLLIYESLSISTNSRCSMISAPVALLSHYLEPYSMCMETDIAIINRTQENYLIDMRQVAWDNVFNVISTNLFNELQNYVQLHDPKNLIYMKIVSYVYLSYKDILTRHIIDNQNFDVPNINDIFSKTFNLMCMYNVNNLANVSLEYSRKVIIDVFYLVLAAYIAKSSTFNFFQIRNENVMNNGDEIVDVRRLLSMNTSSRIFPFLSNISSVHRGYPYNQRRIDALIEDLEYIEFDIEQAEAEKVIVQFSNRSIETNRFLSKLEQLNIDKLIGRVADIVYNSGKFYAPYVTKIVNNIMTLCPELTVIDYSSQRNKRDNIIYILKLLKPFFNIVFEELSVKRYPTERGEPTNTLPRINHNGLNHLRSVYFTAYVLETSNFIEHYQIDNNELFLILLSSYFVSIARFDEDKAREPNINFTAAYYYQLNGIVPNTKSVYFYPYDFDCSHLRYLSNLILGDVFEIIKQKIPGLQTVNVLTKFNIDNALHLAGLSYDFMYIGATSVDPNKERIIDFTSILTIGHYFDHSRPTTGYAQLDTASSPNNHYYNPRGPAWLYNFIVKFYPSDPNDWTTRKSFYYSRIYQTLQESGFGNRVLRDPIPMDQEDSLRANTEYIRNIFYPNVTYNFDAMSIDFHLAWKNIFASFFDQNYNVPPGAWVNQDGKDINYRNAP